jgi:hypothetical protein
MTGKRYDVFPGSDPLSDVEPEELAGMRCYVLWLVEPGYIV